MTKFLILFGIILNISVIISFNISPVPNLIYKKPYTRESDPRDSLAYFGFSLLLRQNSILVGAPKANSTLPFKSSIIEPGEIYKCSVYNEQCEILEVDKRGNIKDNIELQTEIRDRQWLGASITGDQINGTTFMACAPFMKTRIKQYGIGICYFSQDSLNHIVDAFKPFITPDTALNDRITAGSGLSSYWIKKSNSFLLGAPARYYGHGMCLRYNISNTHHQEINLANKFELGYTGYSISAGIFDKYGNISYMVGSPRYNSYGIVSIIDENKWPAYKTILIGSQLYEYFGYAIITVDLNNDKISEIVVSAPFYSENYRYETGAVYIYNSGNLMNLTEPTLKAPFKNSHGRFGSSLASLGDINLDGYNDIAIGAPYEANGVVYIYHGSPNGIIKKPKQILRSPASFNGLPLKQNYFGFSISSSVDVDRNGGNDIAISAINRDTIYLYKSYPIINVYTFFKNFPSYINADENRLEIKSCIIFTSLTTKFNHNLTFELILNLDQTDQRYKLENNLSVKKAIVKIPKNQIECIDNIINITTRNPEKPFKFELNYKFIQKKLDKNFCKNCAIINPDYDYDKVILKHLSILHLCENKKPCKSDLQVKINSTEKKVLVVNKNNSLNITFTIRNYNDSAYIPRLIITNNHNLSLIQIPSYCSIQNGILEAFLWNDQGLLMGPNETKTLNISYDISNLKGSELIINATISSLNEELNATDNTDILSFNLLDCSTIQIMEISDLQTQAFSMFEGQLSDQHIKKTFEINNFGPSGISNIILTIMYPTISEEEFSPIRPVKETFFIANNQEISPKIYENNLKDNTKSSEVTLKNLSINCFSQNHQLNLVNFQNQHIGNLSSQLILNGSGTGFEKNKLKSKKFIFKKFELKSGDIFIFQIDFIINEIDTWNILEIYKKKFFVYKINFSIAAEQCENDTSCTPSITQYQSNVYEIITARIFKEKSSIWIYVCSFVLGTLVYIIIAFILYKSGFFKRKKQEDLQSLKRRTGIRRKSIVIIDDIVNAENNEVNFAIDDVLTVEDKEIPPVMDPR